MDSCCIGTKGRTRGGQSIMVTRWTAVFMTGGESRMNVLSIQTTYERSSFTTSVITLQRDKSPSLDMNRVDNVGRDRTTVKMNILHNCKRSLPVDPWNASDHTIPTVVLPDTLSRGKENGQAGTQGHTRGSRKAIEVYSVQPKN